MSDEKEIVASDLAQVARLALGEKTDDVRLYVARLVRKYRGTEPKLAGQLNEYLQANAPTSSSNLMRKSDVPSKGHEAPLPVDDESRLSLLKVFRDDASRPAPLLNKSIQEQFERLIHERKQIKKLAGFGLQPTKSAIFVGAPGVGKTISARWIAVQLGVPLFVLDLTAVMSSLLGRSGSNLRAALDFAKRTPCVLLLDEIDAIAKKRSDDSDIGELKRLVTVILQEVDEWPSTGLLLAATNHPELIDPALWRRFDLVVEFKAPEKDEVAAAIRRFLEKDAAQFEPWMDILSHAFQGLSFSDIERDIHRFRRSLALENGTVESLVVDLVRTRSVTLDRQSQIEFAVLLESQTELSQRSIRELTGVSRDTIRKHRNAAAPQPAARPSRKRSSS